MKDIDDFIGKVISRKNKTITDEIFLLIQNDREFMQTYLRLVETEGLDKVNQRIGKIIKEKYKLINDPKRCKNPISTLISSHQEFE